jgi:hypothetical protein
MPGSRLVAANIGSCAKVDNKNVSAETPLVIKAGEILKSSVVTGSILASAGWSCRDS